MDLELRELERKYRSEPTWENTYRLLRANQRITGQVISSDTLQRFSDIVTPVFIDTINKLHQHAYRNAPVDEYDIDEHVEDSVVLVDHVDAAHRHLIPEVGPRPFSLIVVLTLIDDMQYTRNHWGLDTTSIALGRRIGDVQDTLWSNTLGDFRRFLEDAFDYKLSYIYDYADRAWGFQGVLAIPKSEYIAGRSQNNLKLLYEFHPDIVLWNLLLDLEFDY